MILGRTLELCLGEYFVFNIMFTFSEFCVFKAHLNFIKDRKMRVCANVRR